MFLLLQINVLLWWKIRVELMLTLLKIGFWLFWCLPFLENFKWFIYFWKFSFNTTICHNVSTKRGWTDSAATWWPTFYLSLLFPDVLLVLIYPHLTSLACTLRWREDGHCCQCKRRPRAFCKVWACSSLRRQCRKAGAQLYRKISTPRSATEQASDLAAGEPHFQSTGNDHD